MARTGARSKTLDMRVDLSGFEEQMRELVRANKDAVRPAAQAGAQVFYDAVRESTPKSKSSHWFHGTQFKVSGKKYFFESGTLRDSIYQVYSKDNSSEHVATYHISWNFTKCPYAYMVHNGTSRTHAARPFVLMGLDRGHDTAQEATKRVYLDELQKRGVLS